ncbi:hypothetical protein [Actinobaculum sp. 352]|uniref:2'-5' RNA ligase family protein n=1 Tax=Actinobaculum sp. 352 TaxID=2490946 RepID=UPI000F7E3C14|nr:hypothetical protein [Actinobaculum sp. 352]RTE49203.1 hypothetical protein EKN07_06400 [Actinobaculum sp. 352]
MENLHEFTERINSFQTDSVPDEPTFGLPPSLAEKIAPQTGMLQPFHGDTVAYFLDDDAQKLIGSLAKDLHTHFGESLSVPLPVEMAHVTLHDLHASPNRELVWPSMQSGLAIATELVARARAIGPIRTRCTAVFNLVNTSVVVGITADDEAEHRKLLQARALFDEIVPSERFTPHITLAYYRPHTLTPLQPREFRKALGTMTELVSGKPIVLTPERLHLLHFDSMGNYWAVQPTP